MAFFCPILGVAPPLCARRTLAVPRQSHRDKGTARHVPVGHATSPTVRHGFWRRSSSRVRRSLPTTRSLSHPHWTKPRCFARPAQTRGSSQNPALTGSTSLTTCPSYPTAACLLACSPAHGLRGPVLFHAFECQHRFDRPGRPP
jgi:hypothetical protein